MPPDISFVIPFKDEEPTLVELFERIAAATRPTGRSFEVIFVDDGSRDGGAARVAELAARHPGTVRLVELRGNFGKSAALAAGFERATGAVVFTLDADLQDDPKEIPRFLAALDDGLDVVSGYKQTRHDPWHKVLPSRVFNWMVRCTTSTAASSATGPRCCETCGCMASCTASSRRWPPGTGFVWVSSSSSTIRAGSASRSSAWGGSFAASWTCSLSRSSPSTTASRSTSSAGSGRPRSSPAWRSAVISRR
jgi:glycosyltransferase involved in cell wall biosynthesis